MSAQLSRTDDHRTNVIPLRSTRMATEPEAAAAFGGDGPITAERFANLVSAIEGLSYQLTTEKAMRSMASAFDAIYISALAPDEVSERTMATIKMFSRIEDRSHELSFDDGMD